VVHVLAVRAGVGELLEALKALERLLPGVEALVLRQVVLMLERFRTHFALVRALTWTQKKSLNIYHLQCSRASNVFRLR
jgi:hypothetical protein